MLWLTKRRHDRGDSFWHNNRNCRIRVVSTTNRYYRRLLEYFMARYNNHFRHPYSFRCNIRAKQTSRARPLMKAQLARLTDSPVVPFGKQDSKPEHKDD